MTSEPELKPCPFQCGQAMRYGGIPQAIPYLQSQAFQLHCSCGAVGPTASMPSEAIAAWNRRSSPQPVQPGEEGEFAWLAEAPGQSYLRAYLLGHQYYFGWTKDHDKALRFFSKEQADLTMSAIRALKPDLFAFALTVGDPWPVKHKWVSAPPPAQPSGGPIPGWPEGITRGEITTIMHDASPSLADTPGSDGAERGWERLARDAIASLKIAVSPFQPLGSRDEALAIIDRLAASPPPTPGRGGRCTEENDFADCPYRANESRDLNDCHKPGGCLSPLPSDDREGLVAAIRAAYEQGCIDTHNSIQNEPSLSLMRVEDAEFGEAADDYAATVIAALSPAGRDQAAGGGEGSADA